MSLVWARHMGIKMLVLVICLAVAVVAVPVPDHVLIPQSGLLVIPAPLRTSQVIQLDSAPDATVDKELSPAEETAEELPEEHAEPLAQSEEGEPLEVEPQEEPKQLAQPAAPAIKPEEPKPIVIKLEDPAPPTASSDIIGLLPFQLPAIPSLSSLGSYLPSFPIQLPSLSAIKWPSLPSISWPTLPSWIPRPGGSSQRYVALRYPAYVYAPEHK